MKTYSDSTLKKWTKEELIKYIRCLEHNYNVQKCNYNDAVDINTKLVNLLNKHNIEWLKPNSTGTYEIVEEFK